MSMDIMKTNIGSWVCFTNINTGDSFDKMYAHANLNIGDRYQVKSITVHNWHTDVFLHNISIPINSVLLDNVNLM